MSLPTETGSSLLPADVDLPTVTLTSTETPYSYRLTLVPGYTRIGECFRDEPFDKATELRISYEGESSTVTKPKERAKAILTTLHDEPYDITSNSWLTARVLDPLLGKVVGRKGVRKPLREWLAAYTPDMAKMMRRYSIDLGTDTCRCGSAGFHDPTGKWAYWLHITWNYEHSHFARKAFAEAYGAGWENLVSAYMGREPKSARESRLLNMFLYSPIPGIPC
jgi:hypothetical protein